MERKYLDNRGLEKVFEIVNDKDKQLEEDITLVLNGMYQSIEGKADKDDVYDKETVDKKIADAISGGEIDLDGYLTKTEAEGTYATKTELSGKQNTLNGSYVSGISGDELYNSINISSKTFNGSPLGDREEIYFKTINGEGILGEGDIEIESGGLTEEQEQELKSLRNDVEQALGEIAELGTDKQNKLIGNYLVKFEQNGGMIDFTQRGFDGLSESTKSISFKTINGQSLFGQGDLKIEGGSSGEEEGYNIFKFTTSANETNKKSFDQFLKEINDGGKISTYYFTLANKNYPCAIKKIDDTSIEIEAYYVQSGSATATSPRGITLSYIYTIYNDGHTSAPTLKNFNVISGYKWDNYMSMESGSILTIFQKDLNDATKKGEGLADAYDVKQYVDNALSNSGGGSSDAYSKQEADEKFAEKPNVWEYNSYLSFLSDAQKFNFSNATSTEFYENIKVGDIVKDIDTEYPVLRLQTSGSFKYADFVGFQLIITRDSVQYLYTKGVLRTDRLATKTTNGAMSAADKAKLDSLEPIDTSSFATTAYVDSQLGDINNILENILG